jgi:DNA-directed RNA polymerase specialized sigma24 family protein
LYYYEDKSYEEIAQIIGSNKNTVWTLLSQAKKKLQEFVNREWTRDILEN